jgi:phytoene dehydrogenase-like protein
MKHKDEVIIIGSGIGGLSCGAYLAKSGYKVKIFERLNQPGGYINTFKRKDYWFDATTHQIGGFNNYNYLKKDIDKLGINIKFIELDHCFETIVFDEKLNITNRYLVNSGYKRALSALKNYFPDYKIELLNLFNEFSNLTDDLLRLRRIQKESFFFHPYDAITGLMLKNAKNNSISRKIGIMSYKHFVKYRNKTFFDFFYNINDNNLKSLFYQYCHFFISSLPDKLNANLIASMIYHLMILKPLMPKNGSGELINELVKFIINNNGSIEYKSAVDKIIIDKDTAKGVRLNNGNEYYADYIVSNVNAYSTFNNLVGKNICSAETIEKIKKYKPSRSVFQVFLGLPFDLKKYEFVSSSNFFINKYDFSNCFYKESNVNKSFLLTNYSAIDDFYSKNGKSSVTIVEFDNDFNIWFNLNTNDYKKKKEKKTREIIEKVKKITGIPVDKYEICFSATAKTMNYYTGKINGGIFGLNKSNNENSKFDNKTEINKLFLVGADTCNSGSITSTFESGIIVSDIIKKSC